MIVPDKIMRWLVYRQCYNGKWATVKIAYSKQVAEICAAISPGGYLHEHYPIYMVYHSL
jgi:hypothetical protein